MIEMTPTPQDIAKANGLSALLSARRPQAIAAALAAERSRWQAAAYDDSKQAAVNPMLYEDGDGPLDLQHRIGNAIDFRKRLAIAQLATAETEVMPNSDARQRNAECTSRDNALPQPAPSPTGAMEKLKQLVGLFNDSHDGYRHTLEVDLADLRSWYTELTRLRSAPAVTEEMVTRHMDWLANHGFAHMTHDESRAALTAALTDEK